MHMKKLLEKIAQLEFMNDQIATELQYVDRLLRSIGFSEGLKTVKTAAKELYEEDKRQFIGQNPPDMSSSSPSDSPQNDDQEQFKETEGDDENLEK